MAHINNILFDLGNVIIDLDIPATENALKQLLGPDFKSSFTKNEQHGLFQDYELGLIPESEFIFGFQTLVGEAIDPAEIKRIWNALLVGIPRKRLDMLEQLRKDYGVFLLSNTNHTHLVWVYNYLEKTYGITDFDTRFFDKPYYSHLINLRKPNRDVYEFVLADSQLQASQTLFIDDNLANVEGARSCGMQAYHHTMGDIVDLMPSLLKG
ncbi:MAG: HAD family phosphatase [Saprospiraceae bacterium]|nr:HAD family phosphatase [Saprospiraceae bacterium]